MPRIIRNGKTTLLRILTKRQDITSKTIRHSKNCIHIHTICAETGQAVTERNVARSRNPLKAKRVSVFLEYADQLMKEMECSPDVVVGRTLLDGTFRREEMVCAKTLYAYIDRGLLKTRNSDSVSKTSRKIKVVPKTRIFGQSSPYNWVFRSVASQGPIIVLFQSALSRSGFGN